MVPDVLQNPLSDLLRLLEDLLDSLALGERLHLEALQDLLDELHDDLGAVVVGALGVGDEDDHNGLLVAGHNTHELSDGQTHGVVGIRGRLPNGFLDTLQRLLHLDVAGDDAVDGILVRQEVGTLVVDAAAIFEHITLGSLADTKDHGVLVVGLKDSCGLLFVANDKHSYPPLDVCGCII